MILASMFKEESKNKRFLGRIGGAKVGKTITSQKVMVFPQILMAYLAHPAVCDHAYPVNFYNDRHDRKRQDGQDIPWIFENARKTW